MMTFLEPTSWSMIVMDGKRVVAKARKRPLGWLLSLEGASWIDPRARKPLRADWPSGIDALWPKYPHLHTVKRSSEARSIMQGLAESRPYRLVR